MLSEEILKEHKICSVNTDFVGRGGGDSTLVFLQHKCNKVGFVHCIAAQSKVKQLSGNSNKSDRKPKEPEGYLKV